MFRNATSSESDAFFQEQNAKFRAALAGAAGDLAGVPGWA